MPGKRGPKLFFARDHSLHATKPRQTSSSTITNTVRSDNLAAIPLTGALAHRLGRCDKSGDQQPHAKLATMYSAPLPASSSMNGMGGSMIDGSGTINPAALNTPGKFPSSQ